MERKLFLSALWLVLFFCAVAAFAEELPEEKIIEVATIAAREKGFAIEEAVIVYDQNGERWCEVLGAAAVEDTSSNQGILKKGFLKNYRIVLFDFKEPVKDVWVFIDKDTTEILEVYQQP